MIEPHMPLREQSPSASGLRRSRAAWILATTIGLAAGMTLSTFIVTAALRPFGPVLGGVLNVLVYGSIAGFVLGICQYAVMPRGSASLPAWLFATTAGAAAGFVGAAVAGRVLGNLLDPTRNVVLGEGLVAETAGALIGLGIGSAQWLVLRRNTPRAPAWIIASASGTALGSLAAAILLGLLDVPLVAAAPATAVGAILGIVAGAAQALVLWSDSGQ